jgi:hypothetical protein
MNFSLKNCILFLKSSMTNKTNKTSLCFYPKNKETNKILRVPKSTLILTTVWHSFQPMAIRRMTVWQTDKWQLVSLLRFLAMYRYTCM